MRFAFIIMGEDFDSQRDCASIHEGAVQTIGVSSVEEACEVSKKLYEEGIDCIELCGAFGEAGAKSIIDVTENKIPVGYVTHLREQDEIFEQVFSGML